MSIIENALKKAGKQDELVTISNEHEVLQQVRIDTAFTNSHVDNKERQHDADQLVSIDWALLENNGFIDRTNTKSQLA